MANGEVRLRHPRPPGPRRRCPLPGAALPRLGTVQARDRGAPRSHRRAPACHRRRDRGLHPALARDHAGRSAHRQRPRRGRARHGADQVARSRAGAGSAARRRDRGDQPGAGRARDRARTPGRRPRRLAHRDGGRRGAGAARCGRPGGGGPGAHQNRFRDRQKRHGRLSPWGRPPARADRADRRRALRPLARRALPRGRQRHPARPDDRVPAGDGHHRRGPRLAAVAGGERGRRARHRALRGQRERDRRDARLRRHAAGPGGRPRRPAERARHRSGGAAPGIARRRPLRQGRPQRALGRGRRTRPPAAPGREPGNRCALLAGRRRALLRREDRTRSDRPRPLPAGCRRAGGSARCGGRGRRRAGGGRSGCGPSADAPRRPPANHPRGDRGDARPLDRHPHLARGRDPSGQGASCARRRRGHDPAGLGAAARRCRCPAHGPADARRRAPLARGLGRHHGRESARRPLLARCGCGCRPGGPAAPPERERRPLRPRRPDRGIQPRPQDRYHADRRRRVVRDGREAAPCRPACGWTPSISTPICAPPTPRRRRRRRRAAKQATRLPRQRIRRRRREARATACGRHSAGSTPMWRSRSTR